MSKECVKGMLAGDYIEIHCTRMQALVLRGRLGEYFDEDVTTANHRPEGWADGERICTPKCEC